MRVATFFLIVAGLVALPAFAKMPFLKKAKELGFTDVKNCQYCHVEKMPTKEKKGEPFAEPGKFLQKKKADTKSAEVDVAWLKDYVAKK